MSAALDAEAAMTRAAIAAGYLETLVSYAQWEMEDVESLCTGAEGSASVIRASAGRIQDLLSLALGQVAATRAAVEDMRGALRCDAVIVAKRKVADAAARSAAA